MHDLNDMVIFAKVAEKQGISAAARELKMPKSKVSRRMASLEQELGVRLLERTTRSTHLTEIGQIYSKYCERVVEEARNGLESVNSATEIPRGHLKVSASVTTGQYLLAPYLAEFIRTYPEIDLELDLNNRRVDVIAEGYDLVVRVGVLDDSSLVSRRLCTRHGKLFASRGYLERKGTPKRVSSLQHHEMLYASNLNTSNIITLKDLKGRENSVSVKSIASINDLTVLRQIAVDGGGIALLPEYFGRSTIESDSLCEVLPNWRTGPFNYYALYPSHRGITLKTRAWLDYLVSKLQEN